MFIIALPAPLATGEDTFGIRVDIVLAQVVFLMG